MDLSKKPLAAALGAAFLATALSPLVSAETDPFAATQLSGGYDLVNYGDEAEEGSCGEGKCGEGDGDGDGEEEEAEAEEGGEE
ncbi:MAG: hypothetical protein OXC05_15105 [Halieaceae bacterium]|nr:hypothetical protein [Halieaceae bacterium]